MASNINMKMFEGHIIEIEGEIIFAIKNLLGSGGFDAVFKVEKERNE